MKDSLSLREQNGCRRSVWKHDISWTWLFFLVFNVRSGNNRSLKWLISNKADICLIVDYSHWTQALPKYSHNQWKFSQIHPIHTGPRFFLKDSLELIISSKQRELYKHYFKMNRPWLFVAGCSHFGFKSTRFHKALVCCPPEAFPSLTVNLGSLAVVAGLTRQGALTHWPSFVIWLRHMQHVTLDWKSCRTCHKALIISGVHIWKQIRDTWHDAFRAPECACWVNIPALLPVWASGVQHPVKTVWHWE